MPSCKLLFLFLVLFPFSIAQASDSLWQTNYETALSQAKAEDKLVLLLFTGSDWCHWCQKLERELFADEQIRAELPQLAIPVRLDFPRRNSIPPQQARHNRVLQEKFKIKDFPTVIILDPVTTNPILTHNYTSQSPSVYLKAIEALND
ncbi:thioredoxin family protein [Pelagicoccus mobilis]|uniref:Thioredoxin family protein n=1 Tax=Pelagicoccus mobilis TaxID=415221 RepID=A0A934RWW8_9BACT|nr:DUF255 domain-containing protein [Pelagicoccus mobilis]MBK1876271.1 thioredoxin family protein [Pelagicoccus mobilis]